MKNNSIGYLKYEAEYIENGIFDARKSAQALLGFDEVIRYFLKKECPELVDVDFTLPVKVTEGSLDILMPENIDDLVQIIKSGALYGVPLLVYLTHLAKKAGADGLLETGPAKDLKKIFQYALKLTQWCIKIRKHLKGRKILEGIDRNSDSVILDIDNEKLSVPINIYLIYKQLPESLFSKVSSIVDEKTKMVWGVKDELNNQFTEETIEIADKTLFYTGKEESEEVLFPELMQGQKVELQGEITRNNNKTNTIGFEYRGHVLTCEPANKASLTKYKDKIISKSDDKFFASATIVGVVDRSDNKGLRPKIKFTEIIPFENQIITQQELFNY